MTALVVSGLAQGECSSGAWCHIVGVFFVHLHVLSKLELAVFCKVESPTVDQCSGADGVRNAVVRRECIQPIVACIHDQLNGHAMGKFLKWESVPHSSHSFLHSANATFNFRDVLVP
jgi:hypothetical protein